MKIENLRDLLVHELKDLYGAERQIVDALPRFARASQSAELRRALEIHLDDARIHVTRLEEVFANLGVEPKALRCKGMAGLLDETLDVVSRSLPRIVDAVVIASVQRIEHYEIAAYGTVHSFAITLGEARAADLLMRTIDQEKGIDDKLTEIAESGVDARSMGPS